MTGWGSGTDRLRTAPALSAWQRGLVLVISLLLAFAAVLTSPPTDAQEWTPPRTVYIPETGHTLDQVFLDQWRAAGGAISFGYPITPEIALADGTIVQYLQYARFEYYPAGNAAGQYFGLGTIGAELRQVGVAQMYAGIAPGGSGGFGRALGISTAFIDAWLPVAPTAASADAWYVDATQHTLRGQFLAFWQATGEAAYLGNPLTEEYAVNGVTYQVFERGQLAWQEGSYAWMVPVGQVLADWYGLDQTPEPQGDIPTYSESLFVPPPPPVVETVDAGPGPVPGTAQSIVVSISQQQLWAYEGNTMVLSTLVSTGRSGFETPTGMFSIVVKKPIEDMAGVIGGEYYDVPQVPDVLYFTGEGHALHGTYWHSNFGTPMSHGCINLPLDVAAWMYDWAPIGTPVLIVP